MAVAKKAITPTRLSESLNRWTGSSVSVVVVSPQSRTKETAEVGTKPVSWRHERFLKTFDVSNEGCVRNFLTVTRPFWGPHLTVFWHGKRNTASCKNRYRDCFCVSVWMVYLLRQTCPTSLSSTFVLAHFIRQCGHLSLELTVTFHVFRRRTKNQIKSKVHSVLTRSPSNPRLKLCSYTRQFSDVTEETSVASRVRRVWYNS